MGGVGSRVVFRTWPALEAACARVCMCALVLVPGVGAGARHSWCIVARMAFVVLLALLLLHATVQFPDVNCHRCLMLCTHAPWDTIPHVSWLGCEPTHCVNGAVRGPDSSGRWACGANSLEIVFDSANACVRTGLCPLRHTSCCCFVLAD